MTLSPPLTVSAILVVGLATATWLTSVPQIPTAVQPTRVTIELPATVYTALTLHVKDRRDAQVMQAGGQRGARGNSHVR
jgi:hypothetical protein